MVAAGGLGNCFQDGEVCFWGTFCGPCLYGQIKARTGRAPDCWAGCVELTAVQFVGAIFAQFISMQVMIDASPYNAKEASQAMQEAQAISKTIFILQLVGWLEHLPFPSRKGDRPRLMDAHARMHDQLTVSRTVFCSVPSDIWSARLAARCKRSTAIKRGVFPPPELLSLCLWTSTTSPRTASRSSTHARYARKPESPR